MTYGLERSLTGLERSRSVRRNRRGLKLQKTWLLLIFSVVFVFSTLQWLLSFPPPLHKRLAVQTCTATDDSPYVLQEDAVCSGACGQVCFPRVHGLCIAHERATVCENHRRRTKLPDHLRFQGTGSALRRRVPLNRGVCPEKDEVVWITGTQMVADMKLLPAGPHVGPNPHHEAEKLIPAILLSHLYGLNKSSLYWFANPDPSSVSPWSLGLIDTFSSGLNVNFLDVPTADQSQICFEDAILFSGLTNGGYMPNVAANDWLRHEVLAHCQIPEMKAKRPISGVVVIHRHNSSRTIANAEVIEEVLERELKVPVRHLTSGIGSFCEQALVMAEADFFLTAHGSHNINFLFARPDSIVLEAFPLLYYIDWFHNYVHASRLNHHELYGTWPTEQGGMPLRMRIYALLFGWKYCFSVKNCMNYAKGQRIYIDVDQLVWLLHSLTSSCRLAVKGSWCLSTVESGIQCSTDEVTVYFIAFRKQNPSI